MALVERPFYMDHNATTPAAAEVVSAMLPWFSDEFGNASSTTHVYGARAKEAVGGARCAVASLIGARPEEIVFTSGATESDNLAILGALRARESGHVITCAIEHEAVLESCEALRHEGCEVTVLPVDRSGLLSAREVERAFRPDTALVSVMLANNEIGTIQPVEEIGRLCRRRGVLLHTDAVQAAGRIPLDVDALGVDLMSLTAHKMYGPKGVGALYVRQGVTLRPVLRGSGQEGNLRSGTLNVPGIVGFGMAADLALRDLDTEPARLRGLRDRLWDGIRSRVDGVSRNGHPERSLPNTLNVAIAGLESEAILLLLRDVAALSSGSACASGTGKGSYVIRAATGDGNARSSIRFGLGRSNHEGQVDLVVDALARAVDRLRAMSPGERANEPMGETVR